MSVIHKLAYGVKHILELDVPGQNLVVFADDTFLVSYPKSGNTWTRFLLANLIQPDKPVTLIDMERIIPACDGQTRKYFKTMPRPRIIRDHGPFNPKYKNVIYIVRDPRDVVISGYHFWIKMGKVDESFPLASFVPGFVSGERSPNGSWGENVVSWLATRGGSSRFLLLRYEDMLSQTAHELGKVALFLCRKVTPEQLARAVERSSSDKMREIEKFHGDKWKQNRNMRKDIPFIRSAKAGGWRTELLQSSVALIESAWGPLMTALGYELSVAPVIEKEVKAERSGTLGASFTTSLR